MIILQEDFAIVKYREDVPCISVEWFFYVKSRDFRDILYKSLESYKLYSSKHQELHYLMNAKKFFPVLPMDIDWAVNELSPRLVLAGLKYMAVVEPENTFAFERIKNFVERVDLKYFIVRTYKDEDEAVLWLQSL